MTNLKADPYLLPYKDLEAMNNELMLRLFFASKRMAELQVAAAAKLKEQGKLQGDHFNEIESRLQNSMHATSAIIDILEFEPAYEEYKAALYR